MEKIDNYRKYIIELGKKRDDKMVKIMKYLESKEELNENERFLLDKLHEKYKITIEDKDNLGIIL